MRYTWDASKNRLNKSKHKLSFEDAIRVFENWTYDRIDDREDYGEERVFAIGLLGHRVLVVIYVEHEDERRIISARKAKRHEENIFWQAKRIKTRN